MVCVLFWRNEESYEVTQASITLLKFFFFLAENSKSAENPKQLGCISLRACPRQTRET